MRKMVQHEQGKRDVKKFLNYGFEIFLTMIEDPLNWDFCISSTML